MLRRKFPMKNETSINRACIRHIANFSSFAFRTHTRKTHANNVSVGRIKSKTFHKWMVCRFNKLLFKRNATQRNQYQTHTDILTYRHVNPEKHTCQNQNLELKTMQTSLKKEKYKSLTHCLYRQSNFYIYI